MLRKKKRFLTEAASKSRTCLVLGWPEVCFFFPYGGSSST